MGGFALTNPGIQYEDQQAMIDPQTGQPMPLAPRVQFFKNSAARNKQYLADTEAAVAKTPLTVDPATGAPVMGEPNMPHPVQPKFSDLSSPNSQTGEAQPISSGETKLGKLLHILTSAARGAAMGAGQPNFGAGYEQAQVRPLQIASMRQGLQQQQAQTALTRSQSTMVPTPYGPMPAGLAKAMFPALINAGSRERVAQTAATSRENVADTAATSRENVAQTNKRYMSVPGVGLYDTQQKQLVPNTAMGIPVTPEIAEDYGLPQEFIGKPLTLANFNQIESTASKFAPVTRTSTDPLGQVTSSTTTRKRPSVNANGSPTPRLGGGSANPGKPNSGSPTPTIDAMAQQVVDGTMDPSQLPRRSSAYMTVLAKANEYSQQKYGRPFDVAQASTDYKFANEPATQNTLKYLNSLTGSKNGGGNLDKLVKLSDSISRTDFPPLNDIAAWAKIKSGSGPMAAYAATITEVADQVAKILQGGGSGSGTSDAKLRQASDLFQKGFNKGQIRDVASTLTDLLGNRKRELIGDNRYLQKQFGTPVNDGKAIRYKIVNGSLVAQ